MSFLQSLFSGGKTADLQKLIEQGAYLVDVRGPGEFAQGSVRGAVNIPLDTISSQIAKFKNKQNIIVFCRSGNRSGQAKIILEQQGIQNVVNGGTWENVNQFVK
ncbi:MAG: rhodanese-like domain-containing protein [Bacteroidetes bacterium]|nr:rhodanese-like domain-containing protein [Bacteroidota bacterium]